MFSPTPGETRDMELLPVEDGSEGATLKYLRDQYNFVKIKSKELHRSPDIAAVHNEASRKAAGKLYSAVYVSFHRVPFIITSFLFSSLLRATIIYSTISFSKLESLEKFVKKRSNQYSPELFDYKRWVPVLEVARKIRQHEDDYPDVVLLPSSPVRGEAEVTRSSNSRDHKTASLLEVQRMVRNLNSEQVRCRSAVQQSLLDMESELFHTKAAAVQTCGELSQTIRRLQKENDELREAMSTQLAKYAAERDVLDKDRLNKAIAELNEQSERMIAEIRHTKEQQLEDFIQIQKKNEEERKKTELAIMERHRQEFGAMAFEHKTILKELQAKHEIKLKNITNSHNVMVESLMTRIAELEMIPRPVDRGVICRTCSSAEAELSAMNQRINDLEAGLASERALREDERSRFEEAAAGLTASHEQQMSALQRASDDKIASLQSELAHLLEETRREPSADGHRGDHQADKAAVQETLAAPIAALPDSKLDELIEMHRAAMEKQADDYKRLESLYAESQQLNWILQQQVDRHAEAAGSTDEEAARHIKEVSVLKQEIADMKEDREQFEFRVNQRVLDLEAKLEEEASRCAEMRRQLASTKMQELARLSSEVSQEAVQVSATSIEDSVDRRKHSRIIEEQSAKIAALTRELDLLRNQQAGPAASSSPPTTTTAAAPPPPSKAELIRRSSSAFASGVLTESVGRVAGSQVSSLEKAVERLQAQLRQKEADADTLAVQVDSLQLQNANLKEDLQRLQQQQASRNAESERHQLIRQSSALIVGEFVTASVDKVVVDRKDEAIAALKDQVRALTTALGAESDSNREAQKKRDEKEHQITALQSALAVSTAELDAVKRELSSTTLKHDAMKNQNESLLNECEELKLRVDELEKASRTAAVGTVGLLRRQQSSIVASNIVTSAIASTIQKNSSSKSASVNRSLEHDEIENLRRALTDAQERCGGVEVELSSVRQKYDDLLVQLQQLEQLRTQTSKSAEDSLTAPGTALSRQISNIAMQTVNEAVVASILNTVGAVSQPPFGEADPFAGGSVQEGEVTDEFGSHFSEEVTNSGLLVSAFGTVQGKTSLLF
jgi:hypothetical protein